MSTSMDANGFKQNEMQTRAAAFTDWYAEIECEQIGFLHFNRIKSFKYFMQCNQRELSFSSQFYATIL